MVGRKNRVHVVDIPGDNCPVSINAPISIRVGDAHLTRSSDGMRKSSQSPLRDVSRMNIFLRGWCRRKLKNRMNLHSWKNTQVKITEGYHGEGLAEPMIDVYPKMKKGFRFYKGDYAIKRQESNPSRNRSGRADYVHQEDFSLHAPVHEAEDITFEQLVERIEKRENRLTSIIGPAGSGKTTFMKRLTKSVMQSSRLSEMDISDNFLTRLFKKSNRKYEVVLHVNFTDISVNENISVPDVLLRNIFGDISEQELKEIYLWLLENQSKVLWIMDGLDQAAFDIAEKASKIRDWDLASTSTIVQNLFAGNLFPESQIVFSSREYAVASLPFNLRPSLIVALVGLSSEDSKALFISLMGNEGESAWEDVKSTSNKLIHLFRIPLFVLFIAILLKNNPRDRMYSMSGVLSRIIQILPKSNNTIKGEELIEVMKKLMKMAFHGLKEGRVTFTHKDLKKFGLDKKTIKDLIIGVPGMNSLCQYLLEGDYVFFFCHQTIQEILAAYYIRGFDIDELSDFVKQRLSQNFWLVVLRLLYGVSLDSRVVGIIDGEVLPEISHEKQQLLRKTLAKKLKNSPNSQEKVNLLQIVSETNDAELLSEYGCVLNLSKISISVDAIPAISSLASHFGQLTILRLVNCEIDARILHAMSESMTGLRFQEIDLSENACSYSFCEALEKLVQKTTVHLLVIDFPLRNQGVSNALYLAPAKLNEVAKHISRFRFNILGRKLMIIEEDLSLLSGETTITGIDELHILLISITTLETRTIPMIISILEYLKMHHRDADLLKCYLVIEKLPLTTDIFLGNDYSSISYPTHAVKIAYLFERIFIRCVELCRIIDNGRCKLLLPTWPKCVIIEMLAVHLEEILRPRALTSFKELLQRCEVKQLYGSLFDFTSDVVDFARAINGVQMCHLKLLSNSNIDQGGYSYIGLMAKENVLRVMEIYMDAAKIVCNSLMAHHAKIDILVVNDASWMDNHVFPVKIFRYVREDVILVNIRDNRKQHILNILDDMGGSGPRIWCANRSRLLGMIFPSQSGVKVSRVHVCPNPSKYRGVTLMWAPPNNFSYLVFEVEAQIDGHFYRKWMNIKETDLNVFSLPEKGILRFIIQAKLFRGGYYICNGEYSNEINLKTLHVI